MNHTDNDVTVENATPTNSDICEGCIADGNPSPYPVVFSIQAAEALNGDIPGEVVPAELDPYRVCYTHLTDFVIRRQPHILEMNITRLDPMTVVPIN